MKRGLGVAAAVAAFCLWGSEAFAQSGAINKAVGGYTWEDAAKEGATTKKDGKPLTFAIITHTAGNGFFDPVYVGAQVAANAFGINLIKLGSEAPMDDIPREIQILNQIVNDPTINGVIMTTPQVGAYNDIIKKLEDRGVVVATTNSFDGTLLDRSNISHTGQLASAAAIGGEAIVKCLIKNNIKGGSILFPNTVPVGNIEVNNRVTAAFQATVKALKAANRLQDFKVDAGPNNIGVDVGADITAAPIVQLIESRKDVVGLFGPNGGVTPAIGDAVSQLKLNNKICAYGFDLGPKQLEQIKTGALQGSLGQQPFLQGFYPVIGSEGTLGVITRAVLRLKPRRAARNTALCALNDYDGAVALLRSLQSTFGDEIGAFEIMWPEFYDFGVSLTRSRQSPLGQEYPLYALIEQAGFSDDHGERFAAALNAQLEAGVVLDAVIAQSQAETQALWAIREATAELPVKLEPINFDVSLPIGEIGHFVDACRKDFTARWPTHYGLYFGHIGDSNLHVTLDARSIPGVTVEEVDLALYGMVRDYSGSISAEHGIGMLKRPFLGYSRSPAELACMQAIKHALDPHGILNPGKVLPAVGDRSARNEQGTQ